MYSLSAILVVAVCAVSAPPSAPEPQWSSPAELKSLLQDKQRPLEDWFYRAPDAEGAGFVQRVLRSYEICASADKALWLDNMQLLLSSFPLRLKRGSPAWAIAGANRFYDTLLASWDSDLPASQDRCIAVLQSHGTDQFAKSELREETMRRLTTMMCGEDVGRACAATRLLRQLVTDDVHRNGDTEEDEGPWYYPDPKDEFSRTEAALMDIASRVLQEHADIGSWLAKLAMDSNSMDAIWFIGLLRSDDALNAIAEDIRSPKFSPRLRHVLRTFEYVDRNERSGKKRVDAIIRESAPAILDAVAQIFRGNKIYEWQDLAQLLDPVLWQQMDETAPWFREQLLSPSTRDVYRQALIVWGSRAFPDILLEVGDHPELGVAIPQARLLAAYSLRHGDEETTKRIHAFLQSEIAQAPRGTLRLDGPFGIGELVELLLMREHMGIGGTKGTDEPPLIDLLGKVTPSQVDSVFRDLEQTYNLGNSPSDKAVSLVLDAIVQSPRGSNERKLAVRFFNTFERWPDQDRLKALFPVFRRLLDDPDVASEMSRELIHRRDLEAFPEIEKAMSHMEPGQVETLANYAASIHSDAAYRLLMTAYRCSPKPYQRGQIVHSLSLSQTPEVTQFMRRAWWTEPNSSVRKMLRDCVKGANAPPLLTMTELALLTGTLSFGIYCTRRRLITRRLVRHAEHRTTTS
ncbi:MAG: hypothetical protein WC655_03655 [Candidatus Hydrogenedentales bacterium]|jgi:hypothetical protein